MLTIKLTDDAVEMDKRTHVPVVCISDCPNCGVDISVDLSEGHHLSYPKVGKPSPIYFSCDACGYTWTHSVILRVTLEAAP